MNNIRLNCAQLLDRNAFEVLGQVALLHTSPRMVHTALSERIQFARLEPTSASLSGFLPLSAHSQIVACRHPASAKASRALTSLCLFLPNFSFQNSSRVPGNLNRRQSW